MLEKVSESKTLTVFKVTYPDREKVAEPVSRGRNGSFVVQEVELVTYKQKDRVNLEICASSRTVGSTPPIMLALTLGDAKELAVEILGTWKENR